jgi:hypothetical protein
MSNRPVPEGLQWLSDVIDRAGAKAGSCFLLRHTVRENWRQRFPDDDSRLRNAGSSLDTTAPIEMLEVPLRELDIALRELSSRAHTESQVVSLSSRIRLNGKTKHLSMMNLHTPHASKLEDIVSAIRHVRPTGESGLLLTSGRFFHYYGTSLIPETSWHAYLGAWLMPDTLVSPRYIGHSLIQSYSALRLSRLAPLKPAVPAPVGSWF